MNRKDASQTQVKFPDRYNDANFLSKIFFCWLEPIFFTGCRKQHLNHEDLYDVPTFTKSKRLQGELGRYWEQEMKQGHRLRARPRLWFIVSRLILMRLVLSLVLAFFRVTLLLVRDILVGLLAEYFVGDLTEENTLKAFLCGVGIVLCSCIVTVVHAHNIMKSQEAGIIVRIALTGAIYKKIFNLSLETIGETTIGRIINLASSDVQRIENSFLYIPYVIVCPLYIIVVLVVLWVYLGLGASALVGVGIMVLLNPCTYVMGKAYAKARFASARYTDERIKLMNEIISGIRVIKMYGWEYAFKRLISEIRRKESRWILVAEEIRETLLSSKFFMNLVGIFFMLVTFTYSTSQPLSLSIAVTSIAIFNSLQLIVVAVGGPAILGLMESKVALSRIELLLMKELPSMQKNVKHCTTEFGSARGGSYIRVPKLIKQDHLSRDKLASCVTVEHLTAAWKTTCEIDQCGLTLKDISFSCGVNSRVLTIVGPVGAGKSSILHCLLGELKPLSGSVEIRGSIGYASQDPWVFSGTVRENILFGEEFEEEWYNEVLEECCLKEDMSLLPFGDLTLVGERGVTLSGGQKARVNLARAVYRKADVYILDDPLSAVDAVVGRRLFQTCMSGVLKNSIVVLVTHHLQYAQLADAMLVVDKGEVLAYGSFDKIMNMIKADDQNEGKQRLKAVLNEVNIMHTGEDHMDDTSLDKCKVDNHVDCCSYPQVLAISNPLSLRPQSYLDALSDDSFTDETMQDIVHECVEAECPELSANIVPLEDKEQGSVSMKTYYRYFKAGGGFIGCFLLLVIFIFAEITITLTDWWVAEWAASNTTCMKENATSLLCGLSTDVIVLINFGLVGGSIILVLLRGILFSYLCIHAAQVLHNRMFAAVLRAPVRFFDTNPIGRITNRFSKDLHFLDDLLPLHFREASVLWRFASFLIVAGIANYYVFIPIGILMFVLLLLRWYYLTSAREIKRLEAVARSPLFSHITATLQGLTTIRACGRQDASMEYFHAYQDEQTKGWSLYISSTRWMAIRVDLVCAAFIAAVIFLAIPLASTLDSGLVGLSFAYVLSLTAWCQYAIRNSIDVESSMISVERLLAYGDLQPEAPLETPPGREKPPSSWPSSGSIKLDKMNFRYSSDTPYVLKDITAHIQPAEKIGIIGRTGAGKSSIMQALFRMAEPEGVLEIDGISITEVGLHDLRQNMSIIPQDPVLFSGSVRYNLDPFSQYSDEEIWRALEQVQLKHAVEEMEHQLQFAVSEGGSNFSVGQRQLMCLGRALLRKNKILVIDEATANVDMTTDAIIQETIRREFSSCTTLTIAHRLHTIMDADRIMVLSGGRVREFDHPHLLLSNPSSLLYRMVEQTGESEAERLKSIAMGTFL